MIKNQNRQNESGNVLFLILIAVALFAALSYAVTQSTRSGSGTTERETVLLNSAGLTQYPTTLRTAVVRMILAGYGVNEIGFEDPSSGTFGGVSARNQVFHPQGGGAVYQSAPPEVMSAASIAPVWYFNGNFEIPQIGQSGEGGNDLIAFLPNVSVSVCRRLNEELGLVPGTTTVTGVPDFDANNTALGFTHTLGATFPNDASDVGAGGTIDNATDDFDGQPAGCFRDANYNGGQQSFIFYSVLLER